MTRARMPNRRQSFRRKFRFTTDEMSRASMTYFGTVSFYFRSGEWLSKQHQEIDITRPYEVFLDCAKTTSDAAWMAEAAAIYASFALQYGCPIEDLVNAGPKLANNDPAEPVGAFLKMILDRQVIDGDSSKMVASSKPTKG